MSSSASSTIITLHFKVTGMMCQRNCGSTVQRALETVCLPQDDIIVRSAEVSFATSTAVVQLELMHNNMGDNDDMNVGADVMEEFVDAVECVGFDCEVLTSADEYEELLVSAKLSQDQNPVMDYNGRSEIDFDLELGSNNNTNTDTYHAIFSVSGMSCAVCVGRVENTLMSSAENALQASVVLATGKAKVVFQRLHMYVSDDDLSDGSRSNEHEGFISQQKSLSLSSSFKFEAEAIAKSCADAVCQDGYECNVLEVIDPRDPNSNGSDGLSLQQNAAQMENSRKAELAQWKYLFALACSFTIPLVAVHFGLLNKQLHGRDSIQKDFIMLIFATPVQFLVGKRFYASAFKSLRSGIMGMDFLVAMGTSAAYVYSLIVFVLKIICEECNGGRPSTFETGAMLLTFVTFGKYLEAYAKGKTANALQKLMELQPTMALRVNKEVEKVTESVNIHALQTEEVPIGDIKLGDYLVVIPGARIPTDGIIIAREGDGKYSFIDESALSGEPFPVAKGIGENVYGSCVNQLSVILIQVSATGGKTFLARIVRLIEDAQANKAPIQAIADQVASKFAPCVMVLSAITLLVWSFAGTGGTNGTLYSALMSAISVIVIACPCALGLATPTAVMVGTGVGAKLGLLIKGGAVLEKASTVKTIVFDKTGTLTTGRAVTGGKYSFIADDDILLKSCPSDVSRDEFTLWIAACAESCSEHPLGKAICNAAKSHWGSVSHGAVVDNFIVEPGNGVECSIEIKNEWGKRKVRVGTKSWTSDESSSIGVIEATSLREKGQIAVYVSVLTRELLWQVVGVIGIVDPVKSEANRAVSALQNMGVEVWMCTGDHEITAHAVALQVGIKPTNVCANVKPAEKADLIARLQKRKQFDKEQNGVAMVGDGINDAIALARADVGMAIGAGTEIAVEAADIVLVRSSLEDAVVALHLSKAVFRRIQWNFVWATAYNVCALPVAMGILYPFTSWRLPPAYAGLMMAFSSVSVVISSLLLNFYSKPSILDDEFNKTGHDASFINNLTHRSKYSIIVPTSDTDENMFETEIVSIV